MTKKERQAKSMSEFEHSPHLTVNELSEKLGCSEMTIRRDLSLSLIHISYADQNRYEHADKYILASNQHTRAHSL